MHERTVFQLRRLAAGLAWLTLSCGGSDSKERETPPALDHAGVPAPGRGWTITAAVANVPDVDAALPYYRDRLGFRSDPDLVFPGVDPGEGSIYAILERQGARVDLQIRRGRVSRRQSHEVDFVVGVDDARALFHEFRARDVDFTRRLEQTRWGTREFTIEDPYGNRITFSSSSNAEGTGAKRDG